MKLRAWLLAATLFASPAAAQQASDVSALPTQNLSVTITTGLTFQLLLPGVPVNSLARRSLTIENNQASGTDACYLLFGSNVVVVAGTTTTVTTGVIASSPAVTAGQASIILAVNQAYTRFFPHAPADPIYVTCTTTGDSVHADIQ